MTDKQMYILLGVGFLAAWYLKVKTVETVKDVGNAINPVNPDNVFSSGVNNVGAALSGDLSWTLGGWIYDLSHGAGSND